MKTKILSIFILSLFVLGGCLTSCERRPLIDPDYRTMVRIKVDCEGISNVTCDIYNDKIPVPVINPEVIHVLFYNEQGLVTESFISENEMDENGKKVIYGELPISPGNYKMLAYNFGTENIISGLESFEGALASTAPASKSIISRFKASTGKDEAIVYEPDHLLVARRNAEVIPPHIGLYTIEAEAKTVVQSYYLQIKVEGLEYVSGAQAWLSGLVESNNIAQDKRSGLPGVTEYIPLIKSDDKGEPVICAVFNTFGRIEGSTNELKVTFDLQTSDGKAVRKTFDISDLFLSEACEKHHWLLLEETIKIDPPQTAGGGFDPSVDEWEDEQHDIII